jgi:hypothetical protein
MYYVIRAIDTHTGKSVTWNVMMSAEVSCIMDIIEYCDSHGYVIETVVLRDTVTQHVYQRWGF